MASMVSNSVSLHIGLYNARLLARSDSARLLKLPGSGNLKKPKNRAIVGEKASLSEVDETRTTEKLEALWDDGFGKASAKDYIDASKEIISKDGGPPRWFCPVECGRPIKDSPILLFLPGNGYCLCIFTF